MPENQEDIDAMLAEVSALADEAVADVTSGGEGSGESAGTDDGQGIAQPPPTGQIELPPATAPPTESDTPPPVPTSAQPAAPAATGKPTTARRPEDPSRILSIEVPVIVQLAETTMPLAEIVSLSTGAVIEFEKPSDSLLDLMINNKRIGRGQAVKIGENFGLRVESIGSVRARIQAMGNS